MSENLSSWETAASQVVAPANAAPATANTPASPTTTPATANTSTGRAYGGESILGISPEPCSLEHARLRLPPGSRGRGLRVPVLAVAGLIVDCWPILAEHVGTNSSYGRIIGTILGTARPPAR